MPSIPARYTNAVAAIVKGLLMDGKGYEYGALQRGVNPFRDPVSKELAEPFARELAEVRQPLRDVISELLKIEEMLGSGQVVADQLIHEPYLTYMEAGEFIGGVLDEADHKQRRSAQSQIFLYGDALPGKTLKKCLRELAGEQVIPPSRELLDMKRILVAETKEQLFNMRGIDFDQKDQSRA